MSHKVTVQYSYSPHSSASMIRALGESCIFFLEDNCAIVPQLSQPIERLSGGERARVLIAQLMLQPADVLLLDEPTNDIDIPTLEILEEGLLEFRGSLVLLTHYRCMLDRVS